MDIRLKRFFIGLIFALVVFNIFLADFWIGREVILEGWDYNTSRDLSTYKVVQDLPPLLMPNTFCKYATLVQIIVCSKPSNFEARKAIRETWGSERETRGLNISVVFLLGDTRDSSLQEKILEESKTYDDLIQDLSFLDSYYNLTLKVVTMLKLVNKHCSNSTKYLLKIDDDVFLRIRRLLQVLKDRNYSSNVLIGKLVTDAQPIRSSDNKWYAPSYLYSESVYPNFVSGTSYLMSIDLVFRLYKAALEIPIFHLEDVYITGICAKKINVIPHHQDGFFNNKSTSYDACALKNLITAHDFTPLDIIKFHRKLNNMDVEDACRSENKTKKSESLRKPISPKIVRRYWI